MFNIGLLTLERDGIDLIIKASSNGNHRAKEYLIMSELGGTNLTNGATLERAS